MPEESRSRELVKDEMLNDLTWPASSELEMKTEGNRIFNVMIFTFNIGRWVDASSCPNWLLDV
jgi:hypothetical protein